MGFAEAPTLTGAGYSPAFSGAGAPSCTGPGVLLMEGLGLCKTSLDLESASDDELECGGDMVGLAPEGGCNKLGLVEAATDNGW